MIHCVVKWLPSVLTGFSNMAWQASIYHFCCMSVSARTNKQLNRITENCLVRPSSPSGHLVWTLSLAHTLPDCCLQGGEKELFIQVSNMFHHCATPVNGPPTDFCAKLKHAQPTDSLQGKKILSCSILYECSPKPLEWLSS